MPKPMQNSLTKDEIYEIMEVPEELRYRNIPHMFSRWEREMEFNYWKSMLALKKIRYLLEEKSGPKKI